MNRSTALLPGRSAKFIRRATSRCRSKVRRSSARLVIVCRWQRTASRNASARRKLANSFCVNRPDVDQLGRFVHAVDVLADPVQRLQVAQPALAVLDVGLDDVAAVAHALVPRVALGELLGHELCLGAGDDIVPEAPAGLVVELLVAPQVAAFEDRGADRQVALGHAHHLVERAARMADLETKVPQVVEQRLDHLLAPRGGLAGRDEGDVDVRIRRHLAAAVAADGDQREPLAFRAVGSRIEVGDHVIVEHADQLVDQERMALDDLVPGAGAFCKAPGEFAAAALERLAQQLDDPRACVCARRVGDGLGDRRRQVRGGRSPRADWGS